MPKLGFKLWKRKKSKEIKVVWNNRILPRLNIFLSFLIALVSLYFAKATYTISQQANDIAKTQLKMQIVDTNQQSQLNKLTEIAEKLNFQLDMVAQQLLVAKQQEKKNLRNDTIDHYANMVSLINSFNSLLNVQKYLGAYALHRIPLTKRYSLVQSVKEILESQIQNKSLQEDENLRLIWMGMYSYTCNIEFHFSIYEIGTRSTIPDEAAHNKASEEFSEKFLEFINKMLKVEKIFWEMYSKKTD